MNVEDNILRLSERLFLSSQKESSFHPIGRIYLKNYIDEIIKVNSLTFIYHNLTTYEIDYIVYLFAGLPELWKNITENKIQTLLYTFSEPIYFYRLTKVLLILLNINIIPIIISLDINQFQVTKDRFDYERYYWNGLNMEDSLFDSEEEKEFFGYNEDEWDLIKRNFVEQFNRETTKSLSSLHERDITKLLQKIYTISL